MALHTSANLKSMASKSASQPQAAAATTTEQKSIIPSWNKDFEKRHPGLAPKMATSDRSSERGAAKPEQNNKHAGTKRTHHQNTVEDYAKQVNGDLGRPSNNKAESGDWMANSAKNNSKQVNGDAWVENFLEDGAKSGTKGDTSSDA